MEEQHDCCGRKSFYCSKLALLNDDDDEDDEDEETFGEYVESTKQLKKIRRREEMPKKKDPMEMTAETFFPLILMDISMTHFLMTQQMCFNDSLI